LANKVRVNEKEGKRLNAIIQFMVNSKEQTLSLKEVSEVANLTPTSFCRFFKKHTNKSFREFYRELKMQKAAQSLLYNPNIPIQDIASKSGYFNISSFNRNFKQVFGRSPSDYRKLYIKN
jgi:transcriptional regulator GlxA family with amidase domain